MAQTITPRSPKTIVRRVDIEDIKPVTVLMMLQDMFRAHDKDNSGELDTKELAKVLYAYYKKEGVSRSLSKVESEVTMAMAKFDVNKSGTLDFTEFIQMWCTCGETEFRFQIREATRVAVIALEFQMRLRALDPLLRLRGTLLRSCGGILLQCKVSVLSRVIADWKINRIRDGFRFFRNKAATLQARLARIQAGLEPAVGTTPPETPRWMVGVLSPTASGSRQKPCNGGGVPRSPSHESDVSCISSDAGLPSPMLRTALQNASPREVARTPDVTPREQDLV